MALPLPDVAGVPVRERGLGEQPGHEAELMGVVFGELVSGVSGIAASLQYEVIKTPRSSSLVADGEVGG